MLMLALLSGAIGIFFAHRSMQKYQLSFVNSYFYFLVFLYIFGAYGLAGSGLLENLMLRMEADPGSIRSARLFAVLAGMPLLALAYYMWMQAMASFMGKKLALPLVLAYLLLSLVAIGFYGYFSLRYSWFNLGAYQHMQNIQWWAFVAIQLMLFLGSWTVCLVLSKNLVEHEKAFLRRFSLIYAAYGIFSSVAFLFSGVHLLLPYLFLFVFLAWHLLPLLYLNLYLEKHHGENARVEQDFDIRLDDFVAKYDISKREREVMVLISKGMSNQDISEALFISLQTVKDHVHRIFVKTGVKNRIQLTNLVRNFNAES